MCHGYREGVLPKEVFCFRQDFPCADFPRDISTKNEAEKNEEGKER